MLKRIPMQVEDMLKIMEQNLSFYPEFAKLSLEQKTFLANFNIKKGIAESYIEDGEIIAVGGMRFVGLGEPWIISSPEIRDRKKLLFGEVKMNLERLRDELNIWQMFATSQINENFLEHLGFEKKEIHVWVRKDDSKAKV